MAVQGVDYSSARPGPACMFTAGKRFVVRYTNLGSARAKTMTLAETTALTNAGLRIVTIFEESAGHMLQLDRPVIERTVAKADPQSVARAMDLGLAGHMALGPVAGTEAAKASWSLGKAAGMHPDAPHYFALDVDPANFTSGQWASCAAYLDAAAVVLGKDRVGLYGNDQAMDKLRGHAAFLWQTYAWSEGRWATGLHMRQYKNNVDLCGGAVDLNDAPGPAYYGQWGVNVAMPSDLQRAKDLAISCDPIPYKMTVEISRQGIDCSGFMSLLCNSLRGLADPWVRLFATGNIAGLVANGTLPFLHAGMGDSGDFNIGVMYPNESSSGIGHMAGTLAGFNVESRGGVGVVLGADARGADNALFNHHFHMKIDSTGNVGDDSMSAADVDAVNKHTDDVVAKLRQDLTVFGTSGLNDSIEKDATRGRQIQNTAEAIKVLASAQADDETKILAAIAAAKMDPTALALAVVAGLKAEGVITVDVDEETVAAIVGAKVVAALRQVTFTATSGS